jgi:hypothetical protein
VKSPRGSLVGVRCLGDGPARVGRFANTGAAVEVRSIIHRPLIRCHRERSLDPYPPLPLAAHSNALERVRDPPNERTLYRAVGRDPELRHPLVTTRRLFQLAPLKPAARRRGHSVQAELAVQIVSRHLRVPMGCREGLLGFEVSARSVCELDLEGEASTAPPLRHFGDLGRPQRLDPVAIGLAEERSRLFLRGAEAGPEQGQEQHDRGDTRHSAEPTAGPPQSPLLRQIRAPPASRRQADRPLGRSIPTSLLRR